MLKGIADGIWEYNAPMFVLGMSLGHRMTVVRLANGGIWVHSPCEYSPELAAELKHLGEVTHIVAPNYMHDTYLEGWIPKYPDARFHAPRSFHKVFPHYKITDVLSEQPHPDWDGQFDQHVVRGVPRLHEVVFLHRPTRTLIITDLAFNLGKEMPFLSQILCRATGCYCRFTPSRLFKSVIKDRAALRSSIEHILAWEFDRIVLSHGANIESEPHDALRDAYAFLN